MEFAASQASSRVELDDGTVLTKCDQCSSMHAERNPPTEPPCDTCRVELNEENAEAAKIYMICQRQVITAGEANEVIDLNYQTVKTMMDLYGVKDQRSVFELVCKTFHHFNNGTR